MESVGELLRTERESQGHSVADVAKATRMSGTIIEALEEDRFSVLPAPVYVKGHLRTYSRFLGLDEEAVVEKYLRFTQQQEDVEPDEWDAVELELHEARRGAERRWMWVAAAVVAIVAVALGIRFARTPPPRPEQPARTEAAAVRESLVQAVSQDSLIEWHHLELMAVARERTWVRVTIDGTPTADLTMEAGERRTWQAGERFELDVGAGDALDLYLDGEYLGKAGQGSRVVEDLIVDENGMSQ